MKSISFLLKNLSNLIPYLLLIAIYFFFVNLEARKEKNDDSNPEKETIKKQDLSIVENESLKIKIPVIPYNQ